MAHEQQPYHDLDRDALLRVLDHIPEGMVKTALIFEKVSESRKESPKRLWEEEFRVFFSGKFPDHKVEMYLDAADLVGRALNFAPDSELYYKEVEQIVEHSGIFEREYVDPDVRKMYNDPSNWEAVAGYADEIRSRYVGPGYLKNLVENDSHFSDQDLRYLMASMQILKHVEEGSRVFSLRLAGVK